MKDKSGNQLTAQETAKKGFNRLSNIALEFKLTLLRWGGHIPSHHIRRFLYRLAGVKIGKGSTIHMWCQFSNPKNIEIGEDTIVGDHAMLDGRAKLTIGNHVAIVSSVKLYNSRHDIDSEHFSAYDAPIIIKDYVFIGPNVVVLPGVTIEMGAVVGAGAVVTKDIPAFAVYGGVPAREIRKRTVTQLQYKLGRARWFQ